MQLSARRQLILVIAIALISVGGAYALFYVARSSGGWGTSNHGTFVEPAVTAAELSWPLALVDRRVWWLWTVASDCEARCRKAVKDLRALQILLNRDADRVRRGFSGSPGAPPPGWLDEYPAITAFDANTKRLAPGVYIVDPIGNLVLFYPFEVDPKLILEDLKHLLRVSQIG